MDAITGLTLFKSIADAGKTIAEIGKGVNNHETKQQLNGIYDNLMDLKQQAARLEDENRELKEKLRLASKPKPIPNIHCLGSKTLLLREGLNGSGWYEDSSKNSMNAVGAKVCFKNHSSDETSKTVAKPYDIRASLTFLDESGQEIGTGISEACWTGDLRQINFGVEEAHCIVVLLMVGEQFICPYLRRTRSHWGDGIVMDAFKFDAMPKTVVIRLLEDNSPLLPPCYFDVAMSDGKLALKQRTA